MNAITDDKLYDLFVDTVKQCSSATVALDDEEIEYKIFEEFDIGVHTYFHDDNLNRLAEAGMISKEALFVSQEIRRIWIELEPANWTLTEIKSHPQWSHLFGLCDKLLSLLGEKA